MLTQEQIAFFHTNGYLVLEDVWSEAELREARQQMNAVLNDPDSARPGVGFSYEPPEEAGNFPLDPNNPRRVWMLSIRRWQATGGTTTSETRVS